MHRQTQMLAGQGIDLDRSTLVHWIERAAWWLKPLHTLLLETVMSVDEDFLRRHPVAGAGSYAAANPDRAIMVLRGG